MLVTPPSMRICEASSRAEAARKEPTLGETLADLCASVVADRYIAREEGKRFILQV